MNAITPIIKASPLPSPRTGQINIRPARQADLPFMDAMQKRHTKQLGYFPTKQFEEYIAAGAVLIAEEVASYELLVASREPGDPSLATSNYQPATPLGYIISRDRYLKRDELGVIFQLCVSPSAQRGLVGASLIREVFARSAYGCRLYCCWCAQDLEANHFWEAMGFIPLAFRAGSGKKKRVHIYWQRRINEGDDSTPLWYPFQTNAGAIRADRLVLPIPPGMHWKDVHPVALPEEQGAKQATAAARTRRTGRVDDAERFADGPVEPTPKPRAKVQFGLPGRSTPPPPEAEQAKAETGNGQRPAHEKPKARSDPAKSIDPKYLAGARELRDRYLEQMNLQALPPAGKYEIARPSLSAPIAAASPNLLDNTSAPPRLLLEAA
jgi:ribosomal protein S18 acetylase RimI-like enzyme